MSKKGRKGKGRRRGGRKAARGAKKDKSIPFFLAAGAGVSALKIMSTKTPSGTASPVDELMYKGSTIPLRVTKAANAIVANAMSADSYPAVGGLVLDWLAPKRVHRSIRKLTHGKLS